MALIQEVRCSLVVVVKPLVSLYILVVSSCMEQEENDASCYCVTNMCAFIFLLWKCSSIFCCVYMCFCVKKDTSWKRKLLIDLKHLGNAWRISNREEEESGSGGRRGRCGWKRRRATGEKFAASFAGAGEATTGVGVGWIGLGLGLSLYMDWRERGEWLDPDPMVVRSD